MFPNPDDEEAIYPLTTREIAEAQRHYRTLNTIADNHVYTTKLVENAKVCCKNGKMAISAYSIVQ